VLTFINIKTFGPGAIKSNFKQVLPKNACFAIYILISYKMDGTVIEYPQYCVSIS
jgi:hypothetical protein